MIIKHCIIVKWNNREDMKEKNDEIKELFNHVLEINGVYNVQLIPNVINRENRYDLMISIEMEESALEKYDHCLYHQQWKEKYGKFIERKAIFDYEVVER